MVGSTRTQRRALVALGVVAAAAAVAVGVALATDDDDDAGDDRTTTTTARGTTSTAGVTSTSVPPDPADVAVAAYPDLRGDVRFSDPRLLVEAFATQVLGFDTDLVIAPFQQGDARSGEVPVSPRADGPTTTVAVRQVSDDSWVVVAATSELIRLDVPAAGAELTAPQPLAGAATAFEGHVDVGLYADGAAAPVATTFVTGSGGGELGPFTGELAFEPPDDATHGVLVLTAGGGEDGTTQYATAIRVAF